MPKYLITSPDGQKFEVDAPEGATEQDALAYVQKNASKPQAKQDFSFDPMRDMNGFQRVAAGAGKAVVDTLRGAGQMLGLADRADVAEARKLDAPLMKTTGGQVGNFAGNLAMLAPTSLIPGAQTVPGAALIGAAAGLVQPSTSTRETLTNVALGGVGGAGGQAVANKIGTMTANRAQANLQQGIAQQASDAQKMAAAKAGMGQGYVIPPADLNPGLMTEALSGLSGKIKTAQVASQKNQQVTDRLARSAVGLNADDALTADVLQSIRAQAGGAYDAIKSSGTVTADKQFVQALDTIASKYQGAGRSFPGLQSNGVEDLVTSLRQGKFEAGDAVDATKVLREMADKAYRQGDTGLGKAAKDASNALEGMLERHLVALGDKDGLKAFQDARKLIAKTYTVQKALNDQTGSVSAQKLAADLSKGKPLSGDLLAIAQMGQAFPKAMQSLKETPKAISPLDFAVGAGGSISTGNPLTMATIAARPAARAALLSPMYQRAALQQSAPSAGVAGLLDADLFRLLGAPVGTTGGLLSVDR